MITLVRSNVVKVVDSEEKAEKLKAKGFKLLSCPSESDNKQDSDIFHCPYCDKTYKTQEYLEKHIAKQHSNGGGNDGADPAKDNAGGNE